MKIDKAIEILTILTYSGLGPPNPDTADALKLGIEALKRIKEDRHFSGIRSTKPLPGETQ